MLFKRSGLRSGSVWLFIYDCFYLVPLARLVGDDVVCRRLPLHLPICHDGLLISVPSLGSLFQIGSFMYTDTTDFTLCRILKMSTCLQIALSIVLSIVLSSLDRQLFLFTLDHLWCCVVNRTHLVIANPIPAQ